MKYPHKHQGKLTEYREQTVILIYMQRPIYTRESAGLSIKVQCVYTDHVELTKLAFSSAESKWNTEYV